MMEPIPSINKAFSLVLHQERQIISGVNVELKSHMSKASKFYDSSGNHNPYSRRGNTSSYSRGG